ncbi:MAG: 3-oxoacyl-ACP reductase [Propioniciclava sp.]
MGVLESLITSPIGRRLAAQAGLTEPPVLRRGCTAPTGPVVSATLPGGGIGSATLDLLGVGVIQPLLDVAEARQVDSRGRGQPPAYPERPGAAVVDATGLRHLDELELLRQVLRPLMRSLTASGRVILLGPTDAVAGPEPRAVAQALDGINRTVAKELRGGSTANLVQVRPDAAPEDLASTFSFLLQGRSAFVSGQTWQVGPATPGDRPGPDDDRDRPLAGRIVVVTGAARGIGAEIARICARDGASVVAVDIPAAGEALAAVANAIGGSAIQADITAPEAAARIAAQVVAGHGPAARIWAIVHNAGITRDRLLANLDEVGWEQVMAVNLKAEIQLNAVLLDPELAGGLAEHARIIGIASTSGIAGNKGQTNYAASKAGVIGAVRAESLALAEKPITVNAVAPGFIETEMTAAIPFVQREIFRRSNSLGQGGQPVDVAETIAWLADPASGGVQGQIVRVCGQNLVGA